MPASGADLDPALDKAFQSLTKLELGQDLATFNPIRQAVSRAHADREVQTDLETRLIGVLQGNATDLAKDFACRQLTLVGSDRSVPVLAELLSNARLSYMARHAMEGIGSPAASKALRAAIEKTSGRQRVGAVISLGRLADADAVGAISSLLDEKDAELCGVAVIALGRIATARAAKALEAFAGKAPEALKVAVVDAQLEAAEGLCQRHEYPAAIALYKSLQSSQSEPVRAAAFRGLIAAKPAESLTMIIAGLAADEPWKRAVAADCVLTLKKPEVIKTLASAVPTLPTAGKIAALVSLKKRCHPAIREAALSSLNQADAQVRTAALQALIVSGTARDVALLADLASTSEEPPVRDAAFKTLCLMPARGTNRALLSLMTEAKTLNPIVVRCARARRSAELVPAFLQAARSADKAIRLEAFKALEIMATEKDVDSLVGLLSESLPGAQREAAGRAVWMACQKISDPARRPAPLLAAIKKADAAGQCAILPSLARMGGAQSLDAVHSAMSSKDRAVRDAGYRALANWPDATVADELLDIVKTSDVEPYRIWSLRAFARVVSLPGAFPPQKTFEMLNGAMRLATRTEERQLIVTRLGAVRVPDALTLLLSFVDDPELKKAAVPAVFTLAKGLSQSHPDLAIAALLKIRPLTNDPVVLQQIAKVLRDIEARKQGRKK